MIYKYVYLGVGWLVVCERISKGFLVVVEVDVSMGFGFSINFSDFGFVFWEMLICDRVVVLLGIFLFCISICIWSLFFSKFIVVFIIVFWIK